MEMTTIARESQKGFAIGSTVRAVARFKAQQKAGIALLQKTGHGTEVLLVQQADGHWSLPKGKRKTGESIKQTGLRECRKETGHEAPACALRAGG